MSTYKSIKGESIVGRTSNFTSPSTEGQVFYNTTDNVFRTLISAKSWSSGGRMTTARYGPGGGGTTTAGLVFGGYDGSNQSNLTEEYNGTGFSNGGNLGTARSGNAGTGTQTAGLSAGGVNTPSQYVANVEEYDGSSWSEVNDLPTAKGYMLQGGTQTATFVGGGRQGPPYSNPTATLEYDGTNWTSGGTLGVANYHGSSGGTLTAGWNLGGSPGPGAAPGRTNTSQFYDGTSWTAGPNGPTEINSGSGAGSQTNALAFTNGDASNPGGNNVLYEYDGSTWAVSPATLGTARRSGARGGMSATANQALAMGGRIGTPATGVTEEFSVSINTITGAAWASGGNMNSSLRDRGGAGTQTAALAAGGENPRTDNSEEYDGTSWSEGNNLVSTDRNQLCGAGSQTAALMFGGEDSTTTNVSQTEEYDGTSYTESNDMSNGRRDFQGFGTQTAAVAAAGWTPPGVSTYNTAVEHYDGTSWSSGTATPAVRSQGAGYGTQTAGLIVGGFQPGPTLLSSSVEYDGSSWTAGGSMNKGRSAIAQGNGSQTSALAASGGPGNMTNCEIYNGTSWVTTASVSTGRGQTNGLMSSAGATAGLIAGGYDTANRNATEEFTSETSALGFSTITTS